MKKSNRLMGIALSGLMMLSAVAVPQAMPQEMQETYSVVQTIEAEAADVRKGYFNGYAGCWTGYTYINATKSGFGFYKSPKIKVCSFDRIGLRSYSLISVEVRTSSGKLIGVYKVRSGQKLTLPGRYSGYKVRITPYTCRWEANTWLNGGGCYMWSIDASENCYFAR
ncbi:MAG: hypothetical protein E7502_02205 [Ruminococcus sp.]|nr:hypothetical protein [Ruminococcus sp.]